MPAQLKGVSAARFALGGGGGLSYARRMDPLLARHIAACNTAILPGDRLELRIGAALIGYVPHAIAAALRSFDAVTVSETAMLLCAPAADKLPALAEAAVRLGFGQARGEMFDVRATEDGPVLAQIDRGALAMFGITACGVHLNGLVRRPDGVHVWVAYRARDKLLDPGKLDHMVAGGISAGMDAVGTLVKEGAEEAGLPEELARRAMPAGVIRYAMERPEGLRRDVLFCYDVDLPEDFVPHAADGEVERFELWPAARLLETVRHTDDVKFNVNLVLIGLFQRLGMV